MNALIDQIPPHNKKAEQVVIGSILRDNDNIDALERFNADDFYFDVHQKIFRLYSQAAMTQQKFDAPICWEMARKAGQQEDVTAAYIAELLDIAPTAVNYEYFAPIVLRDSHRRAIIQAASELIRDCYSPTDASPLDSVSNFMEQVTRRVDNNRVSQLIPAQKAVGMVIQEIMDREIGVGPRPISTGFMSLDGVLGGFRGGEYVILAARPSVGKTALGISLAVNAAHNGIQTLFISLEMSASELGSRMLAMKSNVPLNHIRSSRKMEGDVTKHLVEAHGDSNIPVWIDDRPDHTPASIQSVATRAVKKHGVKMIVLDYLQLVTHQGDKNDSNHIRVGRTSRMIKILARTLNVPIICLAQLNRNSESRDEGRPALADLRESGNIEQDCDVAMLLWPEPFADATAPPIVQTVRVMVEKQRQGPRTMVNLSYRRAVTRFEEHDPGDF